MRGRRVKTLSVIPLVAGALAGCGGDREPAKPPAGVTVSGETESGMKLKVETFLDPAKDPELKKLDAYRAAGRYPAVDYHRVTADNSAGAVAEGGRVLWFARQPGAITAGSAIQSEFSCEILKYEWVPADESQPLKYDALEKQICADGPPKDGGIAAGDRKVYYLITERGFAERGIRNMKV